MEKERSKTDITSHSFKYLDIITVIFVVVLVLSNIASSAKIIDWGFSLGAIRLSFDAGTILFPISYIFGDVITEVYGFKRSRRIIWIGFGTLAFSALVFWLVQALPGEATWQASVGQEAYNLVLGGFSSGGIIISSLAGFFAGSFSNAILMAVLKVLTKGKLLWTRTIGSTIVGEGADTFVFILVAFRIGRLPLESLLEPDGHQLYLQGWHRSAYDACDLLGCEQPEKSGRRGRIRRRHQPDPLQIQLI